MLKRTTLTIPKIVENGQNRDLESRFQGNKSIYNETFNVFNFFLKVSQLNFDNKVKESYPQNYPISGITFK